jgi:hypothetical protein
METDDLVTTVTDLVGTLGVLDALPADSTLADLDQDDCEALPVPVLGGLTCGTLPSEGLLLVGDLTSIAEGLDR